MQLKPYQSGEEKTKNMLQSMFVQLCMKVAVAKRTGFERLSIVG